MITFDIKTKLGVADFYVYSNRYSMRRALARNGFVPPAGQAAGGICLCDKKEANVKICYSLDLLTPEIITHEIFHAIVHFYRVNNRKLNMHNMKSEESFAYALGEMVGEFTDKVNEKKENIKDA